MSGNIRPVTACVCGDHCFTATSHWGVALASPEDRELLEDFTWSLDWRPSVPPYARTWSGKFRGKPERLHRLVIEAALIDHANGNGLDNRRGNLRPAAPRENSANRRPTKGRELRGVYRQKGRRKFLVRVGRGAEGYVGWFDTEAEAAAAYDRAASAKFGKFARLNTEA